MTAARDIAGMRSGRLVAVSPTTERRDKQVLWLCRCECGNEVLVKTTSLRVGDTRSCGCASDPNDRLRRFAQSNLHNEGCWEWTGIRTPSGYGRIKIKGRSVAAHRAMYELVIGPIETGLFVCHKCDNPPCCRPDHLFQGTQKDNCQDAKLKDRHSRGERNGIAKLTDDAVRDIRTSNLTQWELARKYGVWQAAIWQVIHRNRWKHVTD